MGNLNGAVPTTKEAYKLLHDGCLALTRAEQFGMRIDVDYCKEQMGLMTERVEAALSAFRKTKMGRHWRHRYGTKFNVNSDAQLRVLLFDRGGVEPTKFTEHGAPSVDFETLSALARDDVDLILDVRRYSKIRDTYLSGFLREQVDGVLHPFFQLHTARTYRSSSRSINFQNIPKRDEKAKLITRRAIRPRPGHQFIEVDYSGAEVRVSACYHKDPKMLQYINDSSTDMHRDMSIQIYKLDQFDKSTGDKMLRQGAKNGFVFPQFYGDYYKGCVPNLLKWARGVTLSTGVPIEEHFQAKGIGTTALFMKHVQRVEKDFWGNRFRIYQQWKDDMLAEYHQTGFFDMLTGFRCRGVYRKNEVNNYPIQGAAFHCLLWAFIEVDRVLAVEGWKSKLVGQIHDAMVLDVYPPELPELEERIKQIMCEEIRTAFPWLIVPMEVDVTVCAVDGSWADVIRG